MTIYVQSANATSPITLAAGDTMDILPTVSVAVTLGEAINTSEGSVILDVGGAIFGAADDGFNDTSPTGGDTINVEPQGVISATNSAIASLGGNNWITNEGTIQATQGYAIIQGADNTISNSGSIIGFYRAIDDGGQDSITNTGLISSHFNQDQTIFEGAGANTINNSGTISSTSTPYTIYLNGGGNTIDNSGAIEGGQTALYLSDGNDAIANRGLISGAETALDAVGTLGGVDIVNSGVIDGLVSIDGPGSSLVDSGAINGEVTFADASVGVTDVTVAQGGVLSYTPTADLVLSGPSLGALWIESGAYDIKVSGEINAAESSSGSAIGDGVEVDGAGTIVNDGKIYAAGVGVDNSDAIKSDIAEVYNYGTISGTGDGLVDTGGHGVDVYNFGHIDGGADGDAILSDATTQEYIFNSGVIGGIVQLGAFGSGMANSGTIDGDADFGRGGANFINKGEVIGNVIFTGTNNSYNGAQGSVTGVIDASGSKGTYIGGADNDTFVFAAATLSSGDVVRGGGTDDTLKFSSAGAISSSALTNVSGFEMIDLANGTNSITLTNALVSSANGATLAINGGSGKDAINASGVTTATDSVIIDGGGGADTINAGAARDTFVYNAASDSRGVSYDTISGANFAHDFFDIPGAPGAIRKISAEVTTKPLSTTTFNTNLAAAIGAAQLGAHDAVEIKASGGTLNGQTFLVVDLNGVAGYQANADLVIHLTGATGALARGNFV